MNKILWLIALFITQNLYAAQDAKLFEKIFTDWTYAFNHQDLKGSCELFSKNVVADYRGVPKKDYSSICEGFKKIFKEKNNRYQYKFHIHHVYLENHLAAIRITWYLEIWKDKKLINQTQDEGIDIFIQNEKGEWKIVNYLGYSV